MDSNEVYKEDIIDDNTSSEEDSVFYCTKCFSLKIVHEDSIGTDCCAECGCPDIAEASVEEWEELYKGRYGHKFITEKPNIEDNPIFKMSPSALKTTLYNAPDCMQIIRTLYPNFPGGYGRIDSVLMVYDKLLKDNRINELKLLLLNSKKENKKWKRRS